MAITERDLTISNISYTNKDFGAIYPELLDIAKKLSYKFDPTSSNESDPFILLLKLLAFMGDKINYNVDKNVLERFASSLTQETSMKDLTDRLGYHMHYYKTAITEVVFKCNKTLSTSISIPAFSTLKDSTGTVQFVTVSAAEINKNTQISAPVEAYQGELKTVNVLGEEVLNEWNLDENSRIYFPEAFVAENGVFICTSQGTYLDNEWRAVPYINSEVVYGDKVYCFGYDSERVRPYVQFPEWFANIVGDGIIIRYLVTKGEEGNVSAKSITTISTLSQEELPEDIEINDIIVQNNSAAVSGTSPETIDEAYEGLKRTLGTFNTLVTCRDYANAIYEALKYEDDQPYVSNVQVGDRRSDINYSCPVMTYDINGAKTVSVTNKENVTPYDLCLYPFTPNTVSNVSSEIISSYEKTFTGLSNVDTIKDLLENSTRAFKKSLSHDYKTFKQNDIFAIKNYYKLTGIISTVNKVNKLEQIEILEKIKLALAKKYSARNVDFGYEIPYDELVKTMTEADARIKLVTLYEPELTPKAYLVDYSDGNIIHYAEAELEAHTDTGDNDWFKFIVAKNILSGRVEAFTYEKTFEYAYDEKLISGQITCLPCGELEKIGSFTSEANIEVPAGEEGYTLKQNEVIEFTADNYLTTKTYPYGINYYLKLASGASYIPKNAEYTIVEGDDVTFIYTDSEDNIKADSLNVGTIIKPNFDFYTTIYRTSQHGDYAYGETPRIKVVNGKSYACFILEASQEVQIRELAAQTFTEGRRVYWQLNDVDNIMHFDNKGEYILKSGEQLFISDNQFINLLSFGSGTKLKATFKADEDKVWTPKSDYRRVTDIAALYTDGLAAMSPYFVYKDFSSTNPFTATEQSIITLCEGDKIISDKKVTLNNNTFAETTAQFSYKLSSQDKAVMLPERKGEEHPWRVRALLDISAGPDTWQTLTGNQKITFNKIKWVTKGAQGSWQPVVDGTVSIVASTSAQNSFKFDNLTQKEGGENVSLLFINVLAKEDTITLSDYPLIYCADIKPTTSAPSSVEVHSYDTEYYTVSINADEKGTIKPVELITPTIKGYSNLFMLYVDSSNDKLIKVTNAEEISGTGKTGDTLNTGVHLFRVDVTAIDKTAKNVQLTALDSAKCIISRVKIIKSDGTELLLNERLGLRGSKYFSDLKTFITGADGMNNEEAFNKCNFLTKIESSTAIETSYDLDDGRIFFDVNNLANAWVLPEIDFKNYDVRIAQNCNK